MIDLQSNYAGIFATHQHDILHPALGLFPSPAAPGSLQRTRDMKMVVSPVRMPSAAARAMNPAAEALARWEEDTGTRPYVSAFTMEPGTDTNSLAFQVAHSLVRLPLILAFLCWPGTRMCS